MMSTGIDNSVPDIFHDVLNALVTAGVEGGGSSSSDRQSRGSTGGADSDTAAVAAAQGPPPQSDAGASSKSRSRVRILDTIFIERSSSGGGEARFAWFFTSKHGHVVKKQSDKTSEDAICSRFRHFALANPNNTEKYVAFLISRGGGGRTAVAAEELEAVLASPERLSQYQYMQAYVRPSKGLPHAYIGSIERKGDKFTMEVTRQGILDDGLLQPSTAEQPPAADGSLSASAAQQLEFFGLQIGNAMARAKLKEASSIQVQAILDDNDHFWLSGVEGLVLTDLTSPRDEAVGKSDATPSNVTSIDNLQSLYSKQSQESVMLEQSGSISVDIVEPSIPAPAAADTVGDPLDDLAKVADKTEISEDKSLLKEDKTASEHHFAVQRDSYPLPAVLIQLDDVPTLPLVHSSSVTTQVVHAPQQSRSDISEEKLESVMEKSSVGRKSLGYTPQPPAIPPAKKSSRKDAEAGAAKKPDKGSKLNAKALASFNAGGNQPVPESSGRPQLPENVLVADELIDLMSDISMNSNDFFMDPSGSEAAFLRQEKREADVPRHVLPPKKTSQLMVDSKKPHKSKPSKPIVDQGFKPPPPAAAPPQSSRLDQVSLSKLSSEVSDSDGVLKSVHDSQDEQTVRNAMQLQINHLKSQLRSAQDAFLQKETEAKELKKEMKRQKKSYDAEFQEINESHQQELLLLRSERASELSSVISKPSPRVEGATDASIGNASLFIEQLDRVKSELSRQMQKAETERQALLADHNEKITQIEWNYKTKSMEDRAKISEYERLLRDSQDNLTESIAREETKAVLYSQLEARYQDTLSSMTKMKNDFATSLKAANSRSGSISNGSVETDVINRKPDAKLQSELRQLQSKVDFLQSQLEAEQDAHSDMRRLLESKQRENDEIRQRFQVRLQQMDAEKKLWVEETEQRIEHKYAEKLGQQADLQVRFFDVQNQLQVAMRDLALVRQKEEEAQLRASKAASKEKQLRGELENAKRLLEDFQMKSELHFKSEMAKQSRENNMRKLENENEYLKTQISHGETLRAELEASLLSAQDDLANIRVESSMELDKLKADYLNLEQAKLQQEQQLSARIVNLELEENRLKALSTSLKSEVSILKDEVRSELAVIEEKSMMLERLQEELRISREEIKSLNGAIKTSEDIWQQQSAAMKFSCQQQVESKDGEINYLRSELEKQLGLLAESQKSIIMANSGRDSEKKTLTKKLGALHLALNLRGFKRSRLAEAFHQWRTGCLMFEAAVKHKSLLREELIKANEDNKQDLMDSIAMMDEGITKEWQERMRQTTADHTIAMKKVRDEAEAAVRAYKEELDRTLVVTQNKHEATLAGRETAFAEKLAKQEVKLRAEFASQMEKYEAMLTESDDRCNSELLKKEAEFLEKLKSLEAIHESERAALLESAEHTKQSALREARLAWESEVALALELADVKWEERLGDLRSAHKKEISELVANFEAEKQKLVDGQAEMTDLQTQELSRRFEDRLNEIQADVATQLHQQAEMLEERHRADIQKVKEQKIRELEIELQDQRVVMEVDFKERMNRFAAEYDSKSAVREEEFKALLEEECSVAEKTEAGKWQLVIRDIEERHKVDLQHSRQLGWNERDAQAQSELHDLKARHHEEIDSLKQMHHNHVEALKIGFESDFAAQAMDFGMQRDAAIQEAIAAAAEELRRDWELEVEKQVQNTEARVEAEWTAKLAKEHELTEKLKLDITKITQSHASERADLQRELENRDEKMMQLDEQLRDEIYALKQEHQRVISEMKAEFERSRQVWKDSELKPLEKRALGIERDFMLARKDFETKTTEAAQTHKNEMQEVTKAFQAEISKLRLDHQLMSEDMEKATQKIEDLEDAQYDFQQTLKKKDVEISLRMWQANTLALRKQAQMKKEYTALEKRASSQLADTKFELVSKMEGFVYFGMELSSLLAKVDSFRDNIRDRITKYKMDILAEKRNRIKTVEGELDRLLHEKYSLEDERQDLLDEMEGEGGLEAQVAAVEDDIREHSNASSVIQNGRLSVSHAKKKKRLDNELEQLLEIIDRKREQCEEYEARIDKLEEAKSEKEAALIDLEKELVQVLIDQQRAVLALVDEGKVLDEKAKSIIQTNKFDWPPIEVPKQTDVRAFLSRIL